MLGNGTSSETKKQPTGSLENAHKNDDGWSGKFTVWRIITNYAHNTSAHGIPGVARSKSVVNRIFWTVSFLAFTGIMVFFITQSLVDYFTYPTKATISVTIDESKTFPAVSFCNINPMRFDRFVIDFVNYTNSMNYTNTTPDNITLEQIAYIIEYVAYRLNNGMALEPGFFSLESLLLICRYNGDYCNLDDFTSFSSPKHGSCYTFNAKRKNRSDDSMRKTTDGDGMSGLELQLYAHSQVYVPYFQLTTESGFVVMIHDNAELPRIDVAGIHLSYAINHKLAFTKKVKTFAPPPYSDCTTDISPTMQATFNQYGDANYSYSQEVCNILCTQSYIYEKCGCTDPYTWSTRSVKLSGTEQVIQAPLCYPSNPCMITAKKNITSSRSVRRTYCDSCKSQCSISEYPVTLSGSSKTESAWLLYIKAAVQVKDVYLPSDWETKWPEWVYKNYYVFSVVQQSEIVERFDQEPLLSPTDLLSNVGGQTGLWIGISFLSVMELAEMLCEVTWVIVCYVWHIIKSSRSSE